MIIKSLAQTLKDLATGIKNTITGVTGSNATLTIIKGNGTTSTVTVNNVANATNATKATQDSAGQQINTTYIKGLSVSGKTITYTKGDGTTGTITTQDTTYTHPNSGVTAGTYKSVTVNAQGHVTAGSNPTTLAGYGITDASLKGHTHSQYLTASSDLNVNKFKGVISLDNLPAGALERLVKVTNDTARFALTTNDIQLGDTVKVESTKMMYIVKDITKLNSEDGYEQYTAGMASSVPWSGVTGKPSSYTPSTHTHDDRYYTESEINSKVNTINSSIDTKADKTHTHDDRYYTESEINTKLSGKSDTSHTHDDRYYTESEINTKLAGKQNTLSATGSATKGVYVDSSGTVKAMTYSVNKDVPGDAKFTDTVYTHPTTAGNKHIPSGGSSGQILRWSADGTAVWGADNNTTYSPATQSANGLMSAADKKKLDGITTGANAYTHPNSGVTAGTYRSVTVNAQGHVTGGSNPTTLAGYGITDAVKTSDVTSGQNPYGKIPKVGTDGVMEVGRYLDFHSTSNTNDNDVRLDVSGGVFNVTNGVIRQKGVNVSVDGHTHSYIPLSGGTITGQISKQNTSTSWVSGRNIAPFRTIAASSPGDSQYVPVLSAKTYQGSWDIGPYTSNILHFSYITDANFNAGNNTQTADIQFHTNGTVVAQNFSGALSGNAATATKATQDSAGQQINTTYIKELSISGRNITYTKGNGTTGTITTQDTTYNFGGTTFYSGNQNTAEHNANNCLKNGHYYYNSNGPSTSIGATTTDGGLYTQSYDDSWGGQIAQDYRNGRLFVRGRTYGTWTSWLALLDSSNYNNYVPTKTGGGASGTWGINITGNAASATNADKVDGIHAASLFYDKGNWDANNWATIGAYQVNGNPPVSDAYSWGQVISSSTTDGRFQLYASHGYAGTGRLHYRTGWDGDKQPWNTILDSENYNLFTPTKTGGGASGTWGINVSGNSATATKATQDSAGQQINTTYIKGLSVSGKTITYTKGNGTTGTITTQDTVYTLPAASSSTLGGIKMSYGTNDLSAGSSSLATGTLYFVYE